MSNMSKNNDMTKSQHINNSIYFFHLIWLNENLDRENTDDFIHVTDYLKKIIYNCCKFSDFQQCFDYITDIQDDEQKVIMIYSGELIENINLVIDDIPQINSIFIFRANGLNYEEEKHLSSKIKYQYTDLQSICKSIKQIITENCQDYLTFSRLPANTKSSENGHNELEASFIYTSFITDILLDMDFERKDIDECIAYYRHKYSNNDAMLRKVTEFEQNYGNGESIRWYTATSFIYEMLNRALRTMDVDLIIKFGFFIRDLHKSITILHAEQFEKRKWVKFDVYRGQVLSQETFDRLRNAQGGLVSFNNFMSASHNRQVALFFADPGNSNNVGVLFRITLDPNIKSNVFANIQDYSSIKDEEEILFSMLSVFHLRKVRACGDDNCSWEVDLILTTDTDTELLEISQAIRRDVQGETPLERLGHLMLSMSCLEQAEKIYHNLVRNDTTNIKKVHFYIQLATIYKHKGDYDTAENYNKLALDIINHYELLKQRFIMYTDHILEGASSETYEYSETDSYDREQLKAVRESLLSIHPHATAVVFNNLGTLYHRKGKPQEALEYYKKALQIRKQALPPNDPGLAAAYCNIGSAYSDICEWKKAIICFTKALDIQKLSLPSNHYDMAHSYRHLGSLCIQVNNYGEALQYLTKALNIELRCLPKTDCRLATTYNNIGVAYTKLGDYSLAESHHQRALEIRIECLPENHPDTAVSLHNIGEVYAYRNDHTQAITYYEKAAAILEKCFPQGHPELITTYWNLAEMYYQLDNMSQTELFYYKARDMEKSFS